MEHTAADSFNSDMLIAAIIFVGAYALIFSEIIHRTSAAIVGAVIMLGVGMQAGFYTQEQAVLAIDANTLLLLMGMMMMITMLRPTGGFEYLAIRISKFAKGSPVRLLVYLSLAVSIISMFLDNVTTVLIFAPLTVLITRMVKLNPLPYLMAEAMMSNIGGIATLIGDPPNLMIGSAANIDFNRFLWHMGPIVTVTWLSCLIVLLFMFRGQLKGAFAQLDLDEKQAIKDPVKLTYLLLALGVIILLFFVHHHMHLYPAYVAWIGVAIALPLIRPHPTELFGEVEWSVLVFFAGLFSIVGGLEASGLLDMAGRQLVHIAEQPGMLLLTALLLMWVAAILSAVVDNIPFTVTMIPIVISIESHGINVTPLWWALALGAGLGGNGTHIGATANIICVSESERCGIPEARITPKIWLKKGLPTTFFSLIMASIVFAVFFNFFT
ncbi:MAG: citrate transporter [Gammaproteobacteria bacterium]|nr:citrate transporter [Gammaproteobacteria bacterium]